METVALNWKQMDRFWRRIEKSDGCWEWLAPKDPQGYGRMNVNYKSEYAHRLAYKILVGGIPEGRQIDHSCRNRGCVNPRHLRITTPKQNTENRSRSSHGRSGIRGVTWSSQRGNWKAVVTHHGERHYLGSFLLAEEAEAVVIAKRNELFTHNDADRSEA